MTVTRENRARKNAWQKLRARTADTANVALPLLRCSPIGALGRAAAAAWHHPGGERLGSPSLLARVTKVLHEALVYVLDGSKETTRRDKTAPVRSQVPLPLYYLPRVHYTTTFTHLLGC